MDKAVHQPFFGRQAMEKIQVGFTVLNAEFTLFAVAGQRKGVIVDAHFLQQNREDFRHGVELEDAAVVAQRQTL